MPGCYTGINIRRIWTRYRSHLNITMLMQLTFAVMEWLISLCIRLNFIASVPINYCVIFVIQVMCRIYGGYLAEIITATEDSFLEGYTQKMGSMYRFVGHGKPKRSYTDKK